MKPTHLRRRGAPAALAAGWAAILIAAALVPASAPAASTVAQLRVEGPNRTFEPGTGYATDGGTFGNGRGTGCQPAPGAITLSGPSAMGILADAAEVNTDLMPLRARDTSFGRFVCAIGGRRGRNEPSFAGWLYRVDHVSPSQSADTFGLSRLDRVLWYYADFGSDVNTGDELLLRGPAAAQVGQPFTVAVRGCDFAGQCDPVDGAAVEGGPAPATTDSEGRAQITPAAEGQLVLRATHGVDIRSNRIRVCVNSDPGACPAFHGLTIYGTGRPDRIRGTAGWDVIRARAGGDEVFARFRGKDRVNCGRGRDIVHVDGRDVAVNCEEVLRR